LYRSHDSNSEQKQQELFVEIMEDNSGMLNVDLTKHGNSYYYASDTGVIYYGNRDDFLTACISRNGRYMRYNTDSMSAEEIND
jgi:hypothetical protein